MLCPAFYNIKKFKSNNFWFLFLEFYSKNKKYAISLNKEIDLKNRLKENYKQLIEKRPYRVNCKLHAHLLLHLFETLVIKF